MKRYRLTGKLLSPLVVRKERQSQRSEGASSLPGTLVRGALAQVYLAHHGRADDVFRWLFLEEDHCRFGPLDPAGRTFPLSAASCKRHAGFIADGKHGVVDLFWRRIVRRILGRELPSELRDSGLRCQTAECNQDLKPLSGFWLPDEGKPREAKGMWRRSVEAHVGIDRWTHSAYESILYTLPVLEPRTADACLVGVVETGDEEAEHLRRLLETEEGEVRVGHARTRGYGRVRLQLEPLEADPPADWLGWSDALLHVVQSTPAAPALDPGRYFFFGLHLPAGALVLDDVLRYTLDPAGMTDWLPPLPAPDPSRPVLDGPGRPVEGGRLWCLGAITRHERLRGWNAVHGLPRQDEWVVARGAVYAYLFEGDAASRQAVIERLAGLERTGLGARRNEGFGRVVVSDAFHQNFHLQEDSV